MEVLEQIAKHDLYLATCRSLAGEWYLDLFHDVIIKLSEKKHLLNKAVKENKVESLVLSCIYSTFIDAGRKRRVPLIYIGNYNDIRTNVILSRASNESKRAINKLYKKMNSNNEKESNAANTLWQVCNSNIHTVSKEKNRTFYSIKKEIEPILKDIKNKLKE